MVCWIAHKLGGRGQTVKFAARLGDFDHHEAAHCEPNLDIQR